MCTATLLKRFSMQLEMSLWQTTEISDVGGGGEDHLGGYPSQQKTRLSFPHSGYLLIYSISTCVTLYYIWLPLR